MADNAPQSFITKLWNTFYQRSFLGNIPPKIIFPLSLSIKLFGHFGDIIKDIFLLVTFANYLKNGHFFLKWTFGSMIGCFVLPLFLASLNLALNSEVFGLGHGRLVNLLVIILCFPILPFLLVMVEKKTEMELEKCKESQVSEAIKKYCKVRKEAANFLRTELGIENPLQVTFSLLLLFFSYSQTRTSNGLEVIFGDDLNDGKLSEMPFNLPPNILIFLSTVWTCISAYRSYYRRMSWTKDNLSSMAKIVLFFYVMTSLFITISVNIVYFTPALGLFSILRHFQGELFPYYAVIDPYGMFALDDLAINSTSDLCYFSDVPPFPWSDLTRYNYTIRDRPTPPPISLYTYFELETCLYGFWIIWSLHIILVWATKRFSNPKSHRNHNLIEAFTNAIENCQIPAPMFDTCLEPWLLLQKNGPSELILLLKSTGSSEHFDIKIKIVSTADSEKRLFYGL